MSASTVRILQIDPYHKIYGMLVPILAQRLAESLEAVGDGTNEFLFQFMSQLWGKDPGVALVAAIDPQGNVKGHTAAQVQGTQAFFLQPRLDEPTENDAIGEMMEWVENWAKGLKMTQLTLVARRLDAKWSKKYGLEVSRYILTKELA